MELIKSGMHKGRKWKILKAGNDVLDQLRGEFFFQRDDEEPHWIPGIDGRAIGIEIGEYPPECAEYFMNG